jgi:hypothetical protein
MGKAVNTFDVCSSQSGVCQESIRGDIKTGNDERTRLPAQHPVTTAKEARARICGLPTPRRQSARRGMLGNRFMRAGLVDGGTWVLPWAVRDPMHFTVGF